MITFGTTQLNRVLYNGTKCINVLFKRTKESSSVAVMGLKKVITYEGTATGLSAARDGLAATTVGNYALFGGGMYINSSGSPSFYTTVDTYDSSLTKGTATGLSAARDGLTATTVGNYALFGGGRYYVNGSGNSYYSAVDTYDSSLTKGTATELNTARSYLTATTVGNYALFGGGSYNTNSSFGYYVTVDTYDSSLTKGTATELNTARSYLAATTVGNYALFGGGYNSSSDYTTVDTYDSSLTKRTATELNTARSYLAATTVGNYALFGGGRHYINGTSFYTTVDTYDSSLTKGTATELNTARSYLAATTVGNYALFGGGFSSGPNLYSTVDVYKCDYEE